MKSHLRPLDFDEIMASMTPLPSLEEIRFDFDKIMASMTPLPSLEEFHNQFPLRDLEGNPLPNPYQGNEIRSRP
jgi:hypothetical protein